MSDITQRLEAKLAEIERDWKTTLNSRDQAFALLKKLEWAGAREADVHAGESVCPSCFQFQPAGHSPTCELARLIR